MCEMHRLSGIEIELLEQQTRLLDGTCHQLASPAVRVLLIPLLTFLDHVSMRLYPPSNNGWQV